MCPCWLRWGLKTSMMLASDWLREDFKNVSRKSSIFYWNWIEKAPSYDEKKIMEGILQKSWSLSWAIKKIDYLKWN